MVKRNLLRVMADALNPYNWVMTARNRAFDTGVLKSREFGVPTICVGNITVGGTGKTPHIEYIARLLKAEYRIAVLSRGYGRKSKGYVKATADTPMELIGDEPFQIKEKFTDIEVVVCERRAVGIERLLAEEKALQAILLDDAFQHRYVTPGLNIVLMDYNRPIYEDALMPMGMLREPLSSLHRAHVVIVTKCPGDIKPIDFRVVTKNLDLRPYQRLFFTTFSYGDMRAFDDTNRRKLLLALTSTTHVLLVTGIASATPMVDKVREYTDHITHMEYGDHHDFSQEELDEISKVYASIDVADKLIITTEKDAARLSSYSIDETVTKNLYVLPIEVEFLQGQQESFNNYIIDYVSKNSRNRGVH